MWMSQGWELLIRRILNDRGVARLTEFSKQMEDFKGLQRGWLHCGGRHNSGSYKDTAAHKIMNQSSQQLINWPWKYICKIKIPYKAALLGC